MVGECDSTMQPRDSTMQPEDVVKLVAMQDFRKEYFIVNRNFNNLVSDGYKRSQAPRITTG